VVFNQLDLISGCSTRASPYIDGKGEGHGFDIEVEEKYETHEYDLEWRRGKNH
jgi:hypothetical protein